MYFCGTKRSGYEFQLQRDRQRIHRAFRHHRHHGVTSHHHRPPEQGGQGRAAEGLADIIRHPGGLPIRGRRPPFPFRSGNQFVRSGRRHHHLHLRHGDDPRTGDNKERRPGIRGQRRPDHFPPDSGCRRADDADLNACRVCDAEHHRGHRPEHGGGLLCAQIRRLGRASARPNRNLHTAIPSEGCFCRLSA